MELTALEIHVMEEGGVIQPGFGFEAALHFLKMHRKVARAGWNGKGMWLKMCEEWTPFVDETRTPESSFETNPIILMKTADDKLVPWLCSLTDMMAEDWELLLEDFEKTKK